MNDQAYFAHADENADYELDESDSDHQIVVIDPGIIEALKILIPHHKLTNDGAQPQRDM